MNRLRDGENTKGTMPHMRREDSLCETCAGWPSADIREQVFLAASAAVFFWTGLRALKRNRPQWIPAWLAGLIAWATIPKYFICMRCENYGKPCDFFYGGRYAALMFKKQDKQFGPAGYFAEGATSGVFQFLPAIAARGDPRALPPYAFSGAAFMALLAKFCCIDCVRYARDPWKAKYCPTYKAIKGMGLASPETGNQGV